MKNISFSGFQSNVCYIDRSTLRDMGVDRTKRSLYKKDVFIRYSCMCVLCIVKMLSYS